MSFFPKDAEYVAMADAYGPECAACEGDDDAAHVDGCRWIAAQEATPAPLDPSKVKAGDTVTLQGDKASVDGEVQDVEYRFDERVVKLHHSWFRIEGAGAWSVTDHQPAPEPEPEWKPGAVAEIEVDGDHTYRAIRNDGGQWDAENTWTYGDSEVTDVRPLVVIDPAGVDVDALLDSALARLRYDPHVPTTYTVLKTALSVLGIEAAS